MEAYAYSTKERDDIINKEHERYYYWNSKFNLDSISHNDLNI